MVDHRLRQPAKRTRLGRRAHVLVREQPARQRLIREAGAPLEFEPPGVFVEGQNFAGRLAGLGVVGCGAHFQLVVLRLEAQPPDGRALLLAHRAVAVGLQAADRLAVRDQLLGGHGTVVEKGPPHGLGLAAVVIDQVREQLAPALGRIRLLGVLGQPLAKRLDELVGELGVLRQLGLAHDRLRPGQGLSEAGLELLAQSQDPVAQEPRRDAVFLVVAPDV
ncbi:hypothetical protein D3C72_486210 [compost metagenome]